MPTIPESIKKILENENLPSDSSSFLSSVTSKLQTEQDPFFSFFDFSEERKISFLCDFSGIQDSFCFRAKRRALLLSSYLIDEKGKFQAEKLPELLKFWEKEGNIFYPGGYNDEAIYLHILKILQKLRSDKSLQRNLSRFGVPLCHKGAEGIIREVLDLSEDIALSDAHVRRAILSATFTILRQNIGSCFATAPAIVIHEEQIEVFWEDLFALLTKGKMQRIISGVEYSVPLLASWGIGDIKKQIFLSPNSLSGQMFSQSLEKISYSPGLLHALEKVGVIEREAPREQKIAILEQKIRELTIKRFPITIEELLRLLIAKHYGISSQGIKAIEKKQFLILKKPAAYLDDGEIFSYQEEKAKNAFRSFSDHGLLKSWEYTIASFAEAKTEFTQWNLYCSLGMHSGEAGGIGEIMYRILDGFLQDNQKKYEESQRDCEIAFDQMRAAEALLRQAYKESEIRRLQVEHQSRVYQLQTCIDLRDQFYKKASRYANLFSFFSEQYQQKFPEFFQEVYDAYLEETSTPLYEDSPAGFRLVYKHGRSDPSLWTMIYSKEQYVASLVDFFIAVEPQIAFLLKEDFEQKALEEITTQIALHVRSDEFLQSAFARLQNKRDLVQRDIVTQSPWFYISGGSMFSFLKIYGRRQADITVETKRIETPLDLLTFIVDTLKSLPPKVTKAFEKDSSKAMLMHSPTHAFLLLPGCPSLHEVWKDAGFTYTFIRDHWILPAKKIHESLFLDVFEQKHLFSIFSENLPPDKAHYLQNASGFSSKMPLQEFYMFMLDTLQSTFSMHYPSEFFEERIDSFLRSALPLTEGKDWKKNVRLLLEDLPSLHLEEVLKNLPDVWSEYIDAKSLQDITKACYILSTQKVQFSFDLHAQIAEKARKYHLSMPHCLLFADTNWSGFYFGFVLGIKSSQLELWRVDKMGKGFPMRAWNRFFSAENPQQWGVCIYPNEYTLAT